MAEFVFSAQLPTLQNNLPAFTYFAVRTARKLRVARKLPQLDGQRYEDTVNTGRRTHALMCSGRLFARKSLASSILMMSYSLINAVWVGQFLGNSPLHSSWHYDILSSWGCIMARQTCISAEEIQRAKQYSQSRRCPEKTMGWSSTLLDVY